MLTPTFNEGGIFTYSIPHASCGGLGYKVTLSNGQLSDVQMTGGKNEN